MGKILTVKNNGEEKFLRKSTAPFDFKTFSKKEVGDLVRMMRKTMEDSNGIGLAANQIGLKHQGVPMPFSDLRVKFPVFTALGKTTAQSRGPMLDHHHGNALG